MATYFIPKMFRLNRDDGSARFFAAGLQSFADDDKDVFHWYLLANARSPDDFDPGDVAALPADVAAAQMTFGKLEAKRAEQQAVDPRFQGLNERARAMGERAYAAAVAEADEKRVESELKDTIRRRRPPKDVAGIIAWPAPKEEAAS